MTRCSKHCKKALRRRIGLAEYLMLGSALLPTAAIATGSDSPPTTPPTAWERCYGVVKAGKNDCSSLDLTHSCGGKALTDNDPDEYIWVPAKTCAKIVGGVERNRRRTKLTGQCKYAKAKR